MALVLLQLFLVALPLHRSIAPGLGKVEDHGLAEQFEAVDLVNGIGGALGRVEDDKGLSLALQTALRNNINHVSIFGKDLAQSLD